jgi:DNA-binding transcriptional MerR regulator
VWTIGEVARMSGVTSRTLRHYDAVGLLVPSGTGPGGRRLYGRDELHRLQQVLVLRRLDVDLATIAAILGADGDDGARLRLLREHHERLRTEGDRLARLAATLQATITHLEKGTEMAPQDLFEGFDHRRHEPEARQRWGDAAVDRGNASWAALGEEGRASHLRESQEIATGLAAALAAGTPASNPSVQDLVARHHAQVRTFWTPDAASFAALGRMYVDDPRFAATYEAVAPGLAAYVRDAMEVFATTRLALDARPAGDTGVAGEEEGAG